MSKPILKVEIPLTVPVPVPAADGKTAERSMLTLHRPKTRHAKRLASLLGPDILKWLQSDTGAPGDKAYDRQALADIVSSAVAGLLGRDRLDELTAIVADMCGETSDVIDELDLQDLAAVGMAFLDFFPQLRSLALSSSPQT